MAKYIDVQTNFTSGELDPLLNARIDIQQYPNGASKLTNVVVQPQGGVKRRPGLQHLYTFEEGYNPSAGIRLIPFEFSVDDSYMLVFTDEKMHVMKNRQVIDDLNGSYNCWCIF